MTLKNLIITLLVFLAGYSAFCCTTFSTSHMGNNFVGKNYDWYLARGMVFVNKRNVKKVAVIDDKYYYEKPAEWVSKYGNVTFNQYGQEMPNGGMNEKGLVAEVMYLKDTEYPKKNQKAVISELQWIQYVLDNYSTVKEVYDDIDKIRVVQTLGKMHYLVCDKSGDCSTFEYIKGKLVSTYLAADNSIKALTNNSYNTLKEYVLNIEVMPKAMKKRKTFRSLDRFAKSVMVIDSDVELSLSELGVFNILNGVKNKVPAITQWSIVHDMDLEKIFYKTRYSKKIKEVNISDFDFSCKTPTLYRNMKSKNHVKFSKESYDANKKYLKKFKLIYAVKYPKLLSKMINYPKTLVCTE